MRAPAAGSCQEVGEWDHCQLPEYTSNKREDSVCHTVGHLMVEGKITLPEKAEREMAGETMAGAKVTQ